MDKVAFNNPSDSTNIEPSSRGAMVYREEEAYYLANFKAILENCMLPSNPEAHVISVDDANLVGEFLLLDG